MGKDNSTSRGVARNPRIGALTRLWTAAEWLRTLRAAATPAETAPGPPGPQALSPAGGLPRSASHPLASSDPPLWGAYELRILDIRPAPAYIRGHIPESGSIPGADLHARIHELPPKWRQLILVSDRVRDAREAAELLREKGWQGAVGLTESVQGWPGPWVSGPAERVLWEPTQVVRRWAPSIAPGRVLDLGCGSGRDAVYLARRGHEVVAVDLLPDALAMAEQLASRMGVAIQCRRMDLRKQRPPVDEAFDAILMVRFLERSLFPWMAAALRPGGLLILETFARDIPRGCPPRAPRWKLAPQEALRSLGGDQALQILEYFEMPDASGTQVVRLVARSTRNLEPAGS